MVVSYVIVPLDMMEMVSMIASISMNVLLKLMNVHQFKIAKIQRFWIFDCTVISVYFRDRISARVLMVLFKMGHSVLISMNVKMEVQIVMSMLTV